MPQQPNMQMMYGAAPVQQQEGTDLAQQNPTDPQQQAYAQQQYQQQQGMAFAFGQMPFFGGQQGQAPGAPMAPNAAGGAQAGYQQQGMDYSGMMAAQYPVQQQQPQQGTDPNANQDYNQFLLARLQQQQQGGQAGAANPWMQMGYSMPAQGTMEGYADSGMMAPWSATSAGLLGKIGQPEAKKKNVRKKHKDKPKRPLSAYNLFFKDERKKILESIPAKPDDNDDELDAEGKKRKKPPHGKIGFENLAKIIGQRWQKLEPDRIEHYKKLAGKDMKRYKEQMEAFLTKVENEKKKKFEEDQTSGTAEEAAAKDEEEGDDSGEPAAKKPKIEENAEEAEAKGDKEEV